ncbi:MAG: hypothetical protein JEZ12_13045 [Desulfobacterium sp.]|nr:hypothetical protein [Desulfobacterium sp.]
MTIFDVHAEELLLFYEYVQGNPFNGSEYSDIIKETLGFTTSSYVVYVDEIFETLSIVPSFDRHHTPYCIINEVLHAQEFYGFPAQVSHSILDVIHSQKTPAVDICFFELEVLHGIDIFWEDVSSGIHSTGFVKGVHYYWMNLYEYLSAGDPATLVKVNFARSLDRVNMRHRVEQLYNFNNFIGERLFAYGWPTIAWGKLIDEGFVIESSLARYLGFSVNDYLFTQTTAQSKWEGQQTLNSTIFAYDVDKQVQGFSESMLEDINMEELIKAPFIEKLMGTLGVAGDLEKTNTITALMLKENIRVKTTVALAMSMALGATDAMDLVEDSVLATVVQDYVETLQDGFGVSVDSAMGFVLSKLIEDTLAGTDSPLLKWYVDVALAESIGFTEEIK